MYNIIAYILINPTVLIPDLLRYKREGGQVDG
jgi:hypothetical protein